MQSYIIEKNLFYANFTYPPVGIFSLSNVLITLNYPLPKTNSVISSLSKLTLFNANFVVSVWSQVLVMWYPGRCFAL